MTTKSISIKDAGGNSGGRVSKAVELIAGELLHCLEFETEDGVILPDPAAAVSSGKRLASLPEKRPSEPSFPSPRCPKECSLWPERQNCGQECLSQIEIGPAKCLVWKIVSTWYEGMICSLCHKLFGPLHRLDHAPALLGADSKTTEWREFRAEQLPDVFSRYQPICWNCHVTETFRRLYPELVVDRRSLA